MAIGEMAQAAVALLSVSLGLWALLTLGPLVRKVDQHVIRVQDAVTELRRAHEDHVERVDRRMRDVEGAATAAETEGRIISMQLTYHEGWLRQVADLLGRRRLSPSATSGAPTEVAPIRSDVGEAPT